jgi:formylglycine-generating enzyme required for sulfatase activity
MAKYVCLYLVLIFLLIFFGCKKNNNSTSWTLGNGFEAVESEGRDAATGLWKEIVHKKTGIHLRLIPAGEYDMGSKEGDSNCTPVHHVKISSPFYIGKYEVTQAQWQTVMAPYNPSYWKGENLPVDNISWKNAQEFCKKSGDGLRLPTEAEWEYACRAGSKGRWYFGNDESAMQSYAWWWWNSGSQTQPVGQKKPNAWELYDMLGNVQEWCSDSYGDDYYAECVQGVTDPQGPSNQAGPRVLRGGSWCYYSWGPRASDRNGEQPDYQANGSGFRVALPVVTNPQ